MEKREACYHCGFSIEKKISEAANHQGRHGGLCAFCRDFDGWKIRKGETKCN